MAAFRINSSVRASVARFMDLARSVLPGSALCVTIAGVAMLLEFVEEYVFERVWLEALVAAILLGAAGRTAWIPTARWRTGIGFSGRTLLEVAVVLLGASLSAATVMAVGPGLLIGIAVVVIVSIAVSLAIALALGLPRGLAILIACGNSICGNSAIAAVAPVIGAQSEHVASSIAFTAVLGVVVVIALPHLIPVLDLTATQFGVLSGLSVYAVPQIIAATAPAGAAALHIGTLVKLIRVLMLGPVIMVLAMLAGRLRSIQHPTGERPVNQRVAPHQMVPWFIIGFLVMAALRSSGMIPASAQPPIAMAANFLAVVSMAALGLGVDIRKVAQAGPRVAAAVTLSLLALALVSYALIRLLGIP